jgi:iron complex outermembrane recepter protein
MKPATPSFSRVPLLARLAAVFAFVVLWPLAARAQTATGAIVGRISDPSTGDYVRNVEVRIPGTALVTVTEDGGYYRLANVPPGDVTVTATYTGHDSVTAQVNVTAGATATHDFELAPTGSRRTAEETVKLDAFVVSSEREGQAKAVSEQKESQNVKMVVATDNFGDIAEGNIGEFLKFMPGITLDYVETDTRAARMGGLEARYGYVTLDGNTMANTSSGSFGSDTRQFEFEAVSINNVETIEVNKTLNADMPGDAPAGTINLRTKSALDRKSSQFGYTVGFIGNQYEHTLHSTPRPDDAKHPKTRPTASFNYSTGPLLGGKLGIQVNGMATNVFKEQFRHALTYDYTSTQAVAAGHPLITAINFKDGPKMTEKSSGGLRVDYKPLPALRLSLISNYTYFSDEIANRNLNFRVSSANIDPSSTLTKIIALPSGSNANTRIEQSGSNGDKKKDTTNVALNFTYRLGNLNADGALSYSRAREQNGAEHMGAVDQANLQLTRIGWTAERPSVDSPSWYFTQTSGANWYDLNNYGRNDAQAGNIIGSRARGKTEQFVSQINARYTMPWRLPTYFKSGLYEQVTTRHRETIDQFTYTFVGPTGNQLTSPVPASIASFWIAEPWGSNIKPLPVPDKEALNGLIRTHPEYFSQTVANQASNLDTVLGSPQNNQEQINAAYLLERTSIGKWQFQGGLRYEATHTISEVKAPLPISKNPFAIRNANGTFTAATTPDYILAKWSSGFEKDYGSYGDWLPSASARYVINQNLNLKLGYNKSVKRPNLNNIAGPWSVNSADTIITIPNPGLQPERGEAYSAMLEYYFEPAGVASVHVFQRNITNSNDQTDPLPASEVGLGNDPVYGQYEFITFENVPGVRRTKGIEFSYSQQLRFLPEVLRGTRLMATYSRYSQHPRANNFIPQSASGGVYYRYRKFNASIAGTWTDEARTGSNVVSSTSRYFPSEPEYLKERMLFDVGLGWQFSRNTSFFVSGRNAFNSGKTWYYKADNRIRQMERYGGQWTIGVTGNY